MTDIEFLQTLAQTLDTIEVHGFENLNKLAGAIVAIRQKLEEKKKENADG